MADRASGKRASRVLRSLMSAGHCSIHRPWPEVVPAFPHGAQRNSSVWGISQALEDFVGTYSQPRPHGPGIVKNANTKLIGQQPGDLSTIETQLHLNDVALSAIKRFQLTPKGQVCGDAGSSRREVRNDPGGPACATPLTTGYAQRIRGSVSIAIGSSGNLSIGLYSTHMRNLRGSSRRDWPDCRNFPRRSRRGEGPRYGHCLKRAE